MPAIKQCCAAARVWVSASPGGWPSLSARNAISCRVCCNCLFTCTMALQAHIYCNTEWRGGFKVSKTPYRLASAGFGVVVGGPSTNWSVLIVGENTMIGAGVCIQTQCSLFFNKNIYFWSV